MQFDQEELTIQRVNQSAKGNLLLVLSDGRKIILTNKSWDRLNLFLEKKISQSELRKLEKEAHYVQLWQKALELLAIREHSYQELKRKLNARFREHDSEIERCLEEIRSEKLQSDERFSRMFIESRLSNRRMGPFRILADLQQRGIPYELAISLLDESTDQDFWLSRLRDNLEDLCKTGKKNKRSTLGQKLFQRGFPHDLIEIALTEFGIKRY